MRKPLLLALAFVTVVGTATWFAGLGDGRRALQEDGPRNESEVDAREPAVLRPSAAPAEAPPATLAEPAPRVGPERRSQRPPVHGVRFGFEDREGLHLDPPFDVRLDVRTVTRASGRVLLRGRSHDEERSMPNGEFGTWLTRIADSAAYGPWRATRVATDGKLHLPHGLHEVRISPLEDRIRSLDGRHWILHSPGAEEFRYQVVPLARLRVRVRDARGNAPEGFGYHVSQGRHGSSSSGSTGVADELDLWFPAGRVEAALDWDDWTARWEGTLEPFEERALSLVAELDPEKFGTSTLDVGLTGAPPDVELRLLKAPKRRSEVTPEHPTYAALREEMRKQTRHHPGVLPWNVVRRASAPVAWRSQDVPVTRFDRVPAGEYLVLARERVDDRIGPHAELGRAAVAEGEHATVTLAFSRPTGPRVRGYVWGDQEDPMVMRVGAFPMGAPPLGDPPHVSHGVRPFDVELPSGGAWQLAVAVGYRCVWHTVPVVVGAEETLDVAVDLPHGEVLLQVVGDAPLPSPSTAVLRRLDPGLDQEPFRRRDPRSGAYRFRHLPTGRYAFDPPSAEGWRFEPVGVLDVVDGETTRAEVRVRKLEPEAGR